MQVFIINVESKHQSLFNSCTLYMLAYHPSLDVEPPHLFPLDSLAPSKFFSAHHQICTHPETDTGLDMSY